MGPQGSGKSTLLNHLFHTNFKEMDAYKGRRQTTEGIWIARCSGIEPRTIVLDLEGTDGRERGEDDTLFEKQSALFAIAVSDIMLINMWYTDIGREHAANKPLLKIVFQVMLQLCCSRKTTLMFVIRDTSTRTPFEVLEQDLRTDINKIWDSIPKTEVHKHAQLSEFFNVEVVVLDSYDQKEEQFKEQVAILRHKFFQSTAPGGLAGDRLEVVPGSGFSLSAQQIWKVIKENKDLDLPSHRVMVATVRCEEIASHIIFSFALNQDWVELSEAVKSHHVPDFGKKFRSLLHNCLSKYDEDAMYYDKNVGSAKRNQLVEKVMNLAQPTIKLVFKHIRSVTLDSFESSLNNALKEGHGFAVAAHYCTIKSMRLFDKQYEDFTSYQAILGSTNIRDKFSNDLSSHVTKVRATKLCELAKEHGLKFEKALCSKVEISLQEASDNTWPAIKTHLRRETRTAVSNFSSALTGFEMDAQEKGGMISKLEDYGRGLVEGKAREVAGKVKYLMKERFELVFCHGNDSKPRDWTEKHDIGKIANDALSTSLKLLSVLAAIRLDGESDRIWDTLTNGTTMSPHLLVSSTWEKVSATNTLITPIQCKSLWDPFKRETEHIITQAIAIQKTKKKSKHKRLAKSLKRSLKAAIVVTTTQGVASTVCTIGIVTAVTVTTCANAGILVIVGSALAIPAGVGLVAGVVAVGAAFSVKKVIQTARRRSPRVNTYEGELLGRH